MLWKVAVENRVLVNGNEHTGSFSCRGVEGIYQFSECGMRGAFIGHGLTGEFAFETGNATVTVIEKPFWLPESLLKRRIAEGLDKLCNELACCGLDLANAGNRASSPEN